MKIDLNSEIAEHLERCRALAINAEEDETSPLSQRATAMSAMSRLLKELTKTQLEVINMSRLQVLEQTVIDLLNEMLTDDQIREFMNEYTRRLAILEQQELLEETPAG